MPTASLARNAKSGNRELVFTHLFNAPIDVVFDLWTNPEHLPHWYGPHGFTTTIKELDLRPGGTWRLTMHGPDGRDYHNRLIFLEVDRPHRLVYKYEPEPGSEPVNCQVAVTFVNEDGRTRLTMRMHFPTPADCEFVLNTHHADEGAWETLSRLANLLDTMADANRLVIKRTFNAPRSLVFKAWLQAEQLAQWWGPTGFTNPICESDPRPGGRISIPMCSPDGAIYPLSGTFTEILEPELLVFVMRVGENDSAARFEVRNTVTLIDNGQAQTELTLDILVLSANEAARTNLAGARIGWAQTLDRLAMMLESSSRREK